MDSLKNGFVSMRGFSSQKDDESRLGIFPRCDSLLEGLSMFRKKIPSYSANKQFKNEFFKHLYVKRREKFIQNHYRKVE